MHVRIIGAPMDLGADRRGVDIGASAIRYAGLSDHLRRLGHAVQDIGNVVIPQPESQPQGNPRLKYLEPIIQVSEELAKLTAEAVREEQLPLILGGDHSIALGSITGYIYTRGEYKYLIDIMDRALEEARAAGYLGKNILGSGFDHDIHTHTGAGAYICGEETALLSSLEGYRGHPRMKPPFPAVEGLYAAPTVVNNVETLTAVPQIIEMGGESWKNLGTEKSGGTKLWSVSGHVKKPGVYELPMGYADMEKFILEDCGGMLRDNIKLKAVIPGGSSVYIMNADQIIGKNVLLDYEGLVAAGSMVGSGGFIVMDETIDVFESSKNLIEFYKHESCGWCTPCREGTDWLKKVFERIDRGEGKPEDAQLILDLCDNIEGKSFCGLGDAAAWPLQSAIKRFPEDFKKWLDGSNGN